MSSLAIIPARGGSKGIPRKNVKDFCGQPLISWAIQAAKDSKLVSNVVVSTDDDEIASVSKKYGAQVVRRPDAFATDTALVIHSIKHVVSTLGEQGKDYRAICLLEPTAPFRDGPLIDKCLNLVLEEKHDSVATFSPSPVSPHRIWKIQEDVASPYIDNAVPWLVRQKQPQAFVLNGLVYAFSTKNLTDDENQVTFLTTKNYAVLVEDRPNFDIDTEEEFFIAEKLFERMKSEKS